MGVSSILLAYLLLAVTALRSPRSEKQEDGAPSVASTRQIQKSGRERTTAGLPEQLTSALSTGKPHDRERALEALLPDLMRRDISAAARLAEGLEPWASREEVLFRVAREWASQDPEAAVAWARQLPDAAESDPVFRQVCIAVAQTDPLLALDLAGTLESLRNLLLDVLARKDPDAAVRWAGRQTDAGTRETAFAHIALGQAEGYPERAARLVAERISPGPLQDETALAVLHQWILRDPAGARAWVDIFPDGALLERAESELDAADSYPAKE